MILSSVKKEARIILSDVHSIGVLLILPVAFMLIMTFAMSEQNESVINKTTITLSSQQKSELTSVYKAYLEQQGFSVIETLNQNTSKLEIGQIDSAKVKSLKITGESNILIELPVDFDDTILLGVEKGAITINFLTSITPQKQRAVEEYIHIAFSKLRLHVFMIDNGDLDEDKPLHEQTQSIENSTNVAPYFRVVGINIGNSSPTLYSVPSWIVFGLYFIVLPFAITVINEKQNGTLIRLKTFPISTSQYFVSKVSAFYILSLFQLLLLTIVGVFIVPSVTGQPDIIVENWVMYIIGAMFIILAANALAFCVASIVNSYEQAIVLGGGINILLAALSGFMVPIDILPSIMAEIATYSPLYWSAEIIRATFTGKSFVDIIPYIVKLLSFSLVAFSLASYLFINKIRRLMWN